MEQPINCEQVTMGIDQKPGQGESTPRVLEPSGGRVEIVVPSTVTWSEGISPCQDRSWVGY
jgi:hypothetical protein